MAIIKGLYKVILTHLPWTVSKYELKSYFSKYGYIREAYVDFNKDTGLSNLHGYVVFIDKETYDNVLNTSHTIDNTKIEVSPSDTENKF